MNKKHATNAIDIILAEGDYLVVNKNLAKHLGLEEAIIFASLASKQKYWNDRNEINDFGYFYCTAEQLEADTTLSPYKQRKAIDNLEKAGLLKTIIRGVPAKKYFKVLSNNTLYDYIGR